MHTPGSAGCLNGSSTRTGRAAHTQGRESIEVSRRSVAILNLAIFEANTILAIDNGDFAGVSRICEDPIVRGLPKTKTASHKGCSDATSVAAPGTGETATRARARASSAAPDAVHRCEYRRLRLRQPAPAR